MWGDSLTATLPDMALCCWLFVNRIVGWPVAVRLDRRVESTFLWSPAGNPPNRVRIDGSVSRGDKRGQRNGRFRGTIIGTFVTLFTRSFGVYRGSD